LIALPALFLLVFFVLSNALLLSASVLRSENQALTDELTLENFGYFLTRPVYLMAILRTFFIGASVGLLVAFVSFPLAYFLIRTTSRFKGLLIALSLAPLLASVVVRTYGWYVLLDRFGALNELLLWLGLITDRIAFIPSTGGISSGLRTPCCPMACLPISRL
jgi:putative spermidine/putrescine transport system permease protein